MCGAILWAGKQDDSTTLQSIYSMHRWPPLQRRRNEIRWRFVKKYFFKLFWNVCMWHVLEDLIFILCSANKFARSIIKWTKTCGKRVCPLIFYIHHTCEYKQYFHVCNTAKQCRLELFQDSDFWERSWGFRIYFRWNIVRFWKSYACSNQLDVSETNFSFAQFNRISNHLFGAGLKLEGIPALDLWDLILLVFGIQIRSMIERWDPLIAVLRITCATNLEEWSMCWIMLILFLQTSNLLIRKLCACVWRQRSSVKSIIKGKSNKRHVSRTHRVALDWLFERISLDPKI